MAYDNGQLRQLYQQTARKKQLEVMLSDLNQQCGELRWKTQELRSVLEKEQADVQRLEGRSLANFLYSVVGQKEKKLDQERLEAYAAQAKYDAAAASLRALQDDIARCSLELKELQGCESAYAQMWEEKSVWIKASGSSEAQQILDLEARAAQIETSKKELQEAVFAGNGALERTKQVLRKLDDAEGWGTWDVLGGGLVSDLAKHSALQEAQEQIELLQVQLRRFKTELADVSIRADIQVSIDGFLHFADFFFDGLFADLTVMEKIQDSISQVNKVKSQIQEVIWRLKQMQEAVDEELRSTKEKLDELVLRFDG